MFRVVRGGMSYLVKQASAPTPDPLCRRIGFGAGDEPSDKLYGGGVPSPMPWNIPSF